MPHPPPFLPRVSESDLSETVRYAHFYLNDHDKMTLITTSQGVQKNPNTYQHNIPKLKILFWNKNLIFLYPQSSKNGYPFFLPYLIVLKSVLDGVLHFEKSSNLANNENLDFNYPLG